MSVMKRLQEALLELLDTFAIFCAVVSVTLLVAAVAKVMGFL